MLHQKHPVTCSSTCIMSKEQTSYKPTRQISVVHSGSLEVVEAGSHSDADKPPSRPSSSSKRAPPIPGSRNSSATVNGRSKPIIEKSLVSVRRKEEPASDPHLRMESLQLSDDDSGDDIVAMASLSSGSGLTGKSKTRKPMGSVPSASLQPSQAASAKRNTAESDSESDDDSDDGEKKAPNQLIMEFLQCLMSNDSENGLKLCKMILLYEPNHSKALQFLPLLEQKKAQDEAESSGEDDSEESDDSENEDDDDEGDSEEDSTDSDSSDSSEEDGAEPKEENSK